MALDAARDNLILRRVFTSTLTSYVAKGISLGIGLVLTPVVLHYLGASNFGLWVLTSSVAAYITLLDLGIWGALTKYVAEYTAREDLEEVSRLVATALTLYCILGAISLLVSIVLAPFFPRLFHVPVGLHSTASVLILLLGANIAVSTPSAVVTGIYNGMQRFDLANLMGVVGTVFYAGANVAALVLGKGVLGLMASASVVTAAMFIVNLAVIRRVAPDLHVGLRGASRSRARMLLSFSASLAVIQIGGRLKTRTDQLVIGIFLPIRLITPYALSLRLSELPQILTDQFTRVLLPLSSELYTRDELSRLRELFVTSTRVTLALTLSVAIPEVLLASRFLSAWVGPANGKYGYLMVILTAAFVMDSVLWPAGAILQGMSKHRPLAIMSAGAAVANLFISVALVPVLHLTGVALGTLIPAIGEGTLFVIPLAMRTLGASTRTMLVNVLSASIFPGVATACVVYVLIRAINPTTLVTTGLMQVIGTLTFALVYIAVGARGLERQACRDAALIILQAVRRGTRVASVTDHSGPS